MNLEQKIDNVLKVIDYTNSRYQQPCFSCSFSNESMVLLDLMVKYFPSIEIFTIDTGRLHEETYELMHQVQVHYGIVYKTYYPDAEALQNYINQVGHNAFYDSLENRVSCCHIRKVEPLTRALTGKDAWLTGLRWQQSATRAQLAYQEWNVQYQLMKINPMLDWLDEELVGYIKSRKLPSNALYAKGYSSIGCVPCTRPISVGEEQRAGRWWWEHASTKECGLHLNQHKS